MHYPRIPCFCLEYFTVFCPNCLVDSCDDEYYLLGLDKDDLRWWRWHELDWTVVLYRRLIDWQVPALRGSDLWVHFEMRFERRSCSVWRPPSSSAWFFAPGTGCVGSASCLILSSWRPAASGWCYSVSLLFSIVYLNYLCFSGLVNLDLGAVLETCSFQAASIFDLISFCRETTSSEMFSVWDFHWSLLEFLN